ncbi:unnamed protein product [Lactuca virosa]|uniref:PGG domain-containing protein n=1 Tax=Lactuca virosa TaxID=75947 RepID=A0AAU9LMG9_9ASTR|nr:unnamed protein product [Lactuca virosa]
MSFSIKLCIFKSICLVKMPATNPASPPPSPLPQSPLRPCGNLVEAEERAAYLSICVPLYNASIRGDWEAAQVILAEHHSLDLVGYPITENNETALHIAASAKTSKKMETFVRNLVNKMTSEQLELRNNDSNTALCLAAAAGNIKIAMIMLIKNPKLVNIPGAEQMMPLYWASLFGKKEMIRYLYDKSTHMTGDDWAKESRRNWVLQKCVEANLFDVAFKIVTEWPNIAVDSRVLGSLARKKDAFKVSKPCFIWRIIRRFFPAIYVKVGPAENPRDAVKLLRLIWTRILITYSKDAVSKIISGPSDQMPLASKKEHVEGIILQTISKNVEKIHDSLHSHWNGTSAVTQPQGGTQIQDLIWKKNHYKQTIFHVAVSYRHEDIFNLLQEIGSMKDMITSIKDVDRNNMLHLAGKIANENRLQVVSGVALQMQRELLWFKEVKDMVPSNYLEEKNNDNLTPHELFSKEHKDLMSAGEKWIKGTANQSMVVATLITTIAFAAAFTVPGGYNQNNGVPMFLHNPAFIVFVISDAISLTSSSISILIFLSILTSRYAEEDFLESLPKRLLFGLATLFLSIASMMVAFSESFFVLYRNNLIWVPIVISVIASMPVLFYVRLQYKLLKDVYHSTNGSKNLFKQKEFMIYYQNPKL